MKDVFIAMVTDFPYKVFLIKLYLISRRSQIAFTIIIESNCKTEMTRSGHSKKKMYYITRQPMT